MPYPLSELAGWVGGKVIGGSDTLIDGVAPLNTAGPRDLSFVTNAKYAKAAADSAAAAILVAPQQVFERPIQGARLEVANPYVALALIGQRLYPSPSRSAGIHAQACVDPTAQIDPTATVEAGAVIDASAVIGANTVVGPQCYVGVGAVVGDACVLAAGAKLMRRCELGHRVMLQPGCVIGSDGFGYAVDDSGKRHKIPQVGIVVLEDDVEIGANTTIDRATFGETRIKRGTKIDNLVQIAHNVIIGADSVIVSQSGIAGSTQTGERLTMGAQSGLVGHLSLDDDITIGARGALSRATPGPGVYSGAPAMPHHLWRRMIVAQRHLPAMHRDFRRRSRDNAPEPGPEEADD